MMRDPLVGYRRVSWLMSASILILIVLASEYLYRIEIQRLGTQIDNLVLQEAATMRARIEGELNSNLYITSGLVGYVSAHDLLEPARVERALGVLYRNARHIRNVAMAPDNVVTHLYPLAGNEAVIGVNYRDLPQQWPDIERAMQERRTVLAGPIDLVQGGRGLISRTPVFLDEGQYWGILSLVLDSDSLFGAVGLGAQRGVFRFGLRWREGGPGRSAAVAGDQSVFENGAIQLVIPVPAGSWELGAVHNGGLQNQTGYLSVYRTGGYVLATLIAGLVFLFLEERRRVARLALLDQLTGLPNRRWFTRHAHRVLERSRRRQGRLALVYVDLDGFKAVNDRLGHRVGDDVLEQLGSRMSDSLGPEPFLARIGGDEFVILLDGVSNEADALNRMQTLFKAIRTPISDHAAMIELDASVGVALYPRDGSNAADLMNAADRNMYANKQDRRRPATDSR